MHRCLQVPELVGLVCSHIQSPYHLETAFEVRQPKRGDLAVLARTSTVFSSHAVRLLWKSVSLINLLRCLPSDSFELRRTGVGYFAKYIMQLIRSLRASDWERVLLYAQHVKHLFSDPNFADLSSIFPTLSLCLPESMLPKLQGLHWMHMENDFHYIDCFLAPQLTTIHIPHTSLPALSLVSSLAPRCPQLIDITIFPRSPQKLQPLAVSAVSTCVRGLHGIETLFTDTVDQLALEHLSCLPSVRRLTLGELPPTLSERPNDETIFTSLQSLYFTAKIESPIRFLEWCNKIPLVEFSVESPAFSTADEVHRLFSAASGGISPLSLREFTFDNDWGSFPSSESANHLIRPQALHSLFCFVNLTSVSVLSAVGIDLDDATVTDLARSWRYIKCLEFQSYYGNVAPRVTLQGLEAFSKHCPHLTKLTITFDATVIPTSQAEPSRGCLKLQHLDVEASPIATALPVALFLARIFPRLRSISTIQDIIAGDDDWKADVGPNALHYDRYWKNVAPLLHISSPHCTVD
ncbi:hypothetical protein K438DRAFT_1039691 [Mycena galopus ATCC 62051]|nr:hypothetical protein K438DRAFT_1039691 [Mycena galopus ATCC 62051]